MPTSAMSVTRKAFFILVMRWFLFTVCEADVYVVVVAYGTATKESLTGSVAVVGAKEIEDRPVTSATAALEGNAPGVQVNSTTGQPGDDASIVIRGIGSMSASSAPLYVVDGMPYDGSISDINPNDVESMSVLKDAAASAIYGARGANGVVLITTKRAQAADAIVKFDAKWGSNSRLIPQYDVITNPAEYYETHYNALYNYYRLEKGMTNEEANVLAAKNVTGAAADAKKTGDELSDVKNTLNQLIQESAFEIVEENGEFKLYWYGAQGECPYTIVYENGVYNLYFNYTTA